MLNKRKKKILIWITAVFLVIAVIAVACAIYVGDYYRADMNAIQAFASEHSAEYRILDGMIVVEPNDAKTGFIFYPGGKVEHTAYLPLMEACAEGGILCIIAEMPFNLAVFDIDAADTIRENYPEVEHWYIGGHSLGGSMAASYLSDHISEYEGLVLLGAYSTADLSAADLKVISIYGSEDRVLNREKYQENIVNLPDDYKETVIEGGCHAYFGMYGEQSGDGKSRITVEEQINITAGEIIEFISSNRQ